MVVTNNVHKEQQVTPTSRLSEEQKHGPVEDKMEEIQVQRVQQIEIQLLYVEQQYKHMQMEQLVMELIPSVQ